MKKLFSLFIFAILFTIPAVSFAVSGACSSHGGVNCSGASYRGNAVCNDGWESATSFYNTDECKDNRPMCPTPHYWGATNYSLCDNYQGICDRSNLSRQAGCARSGRDMSSPGCIPLDCPDVIQCKEDVARNNRLSESFQKCQDTITQSQNNLLEKSEQSLKNTDCPRVSRLKPLKIQMI